MSKKYKVKPEPTRSGTYRVRWWYEGKRFCKSFNKKTLALNLCRKINDGEYPNNKKESDDKKDKILEHSFKELSDVFIENHVKVNCSPSTLRNYNMYLRIHVLPFFGKYKLKDLHLRLLDRFTSQLRKKSRVKGERDQSTKNIKKTILGKKIGLSEKMQRELQSLVLTIVKYGYERDYLKENPFKQFKLKKLNQKKQEYFTGNEVERFLKWCEEGGPYVPNQHDLDELGKPIIKFTDNIERDTEIFKFALHTGARQGEILGFKRKAIDFDNGLIWFSEMYDSAASSQAERTKGKNVRCLEMDDVVLAMMKKRKNLDPEDLVFGKIRSPMWKSTFYVYCNRAGLKRVSFHALRHTFATAMALYTPPAVLQKILGHSSWNTTMKYVHIAQSDSIGYTKYLKSVYRKHRDVDAIMQKTMSRVS